MSAKSIFFFFREMCSIVFVASLVKLRIVETSSRNLVWSVGHVVADAGSQLGFRCRF